MEKILNEILMKVSRINSKVSILDDKFTNLEKNVNSLEDKVIKLDGKVDNLDNKVNALDGKFNSLDYKVNVLETNQIKMNKKIDMIFDQTANLIEFKNFTNETLSIISKDTKYIKHKIRQNEEDIFDLKINMKLAK